MLALQTPLTDEMITQRITEIQESNETILYLAIGVLIFFLLLIIIFIIAKSIIKKKLPANAQGLAKFFLVLALLPLGSVGVFSSLFVGIALSDMDLQETRQHMNEWHIVLTEITEIETDTVTRRRTSSTRNRRETVTYYFAKFKGIDDVRSINTEGSGYYSVGDAVYAVIDYEGEVVLVYSADDYVYDGSRLKELN